MRLFQSPSVEFPVKKKRVNLLSSYVRDTRDEVAWRSRTNHLAWSTSNGQSSAAKQERRCQRTVEKNVRFSWQKTRRIFKPGKTADSVVDRIGSRCDERGEQQTNKASHEQLEAQFIRAQLFVWLES